MCVCVRCKASTIAMAHDVDSSFKIRLKRNPTESQSAFVYETQECVCLYVCVGVLVCVCVWGLLSMKSSDNEPLVAAGRGFLLSNANSSRISTLRDTQV